ncbi:pH-response regulator protein palH/RIM21 [Candida viswanathii]|uniref:pH-response regulator protein palH/RIM21 n=1 Tax=Candida viswanathii TaxID=5486 RepID=A0A367XM44_9ASCO|nr:pH-response regulator protein palH/RIM21 [Candida viswanathii]
MSCSIYHLNTGSLSILDALNNTWENDLSIILPAYYATNCSLPEMVTFLNETLDPFFMDFDYFPYDKRDNGDTLVALLFVLCGSCVSMWMLSLLLYVSPKYKRKPILSQLATLFYAIVTSYVLSKVTSTVEDQYYRDVLDIVLLHSTLYNRVEYRVLITIQQTLTMLAWCQIILKVSKQRFKRIIGLFTVLLMTAYIACFIYYQVSCNTHGQIMVGADSSNYHKWNTIRFATNLVIVVWFGGNLLYYTTVIKNPRKICYSRKLIPLGIFNWFLIILHAVLNILHISVFKNNWLIRTWMVLIPYLIESILITTVWEWIFNIWILEKRFELMGVLGRRISIDDVLSIQLNHSDSDNRKKKFDKKQAGELALTERDKIHSAFDTFKDWMMNRPIRLNQNIESMSVSDTEDSKEAFTFSNSSSNESPNKRNKQHGPVVLQLLVQLLTLRHSPLNRLESIEQEEEDDEEEYEVEEMVPSSSSQAIVHRAAVASSTDLGVSANDFEMTNMASTTQDDEEEYEDEYDDEYVDDYELWDDDEDEEEDEQADVHEGPSTAHNDNEEQPPPFQPHPGFNPGDYWNDRKE